MSATDLARRKADCILVISDELANNLSPGAHTRSTAGTVRDDISGARERGLYLRWPGRGAPRCWYCRSARGPDRRLLCRPRTSPAWVPWRIRSSPQIHQSICYSKSLKFHTERVRRQFLSLRHPVSALPGSRDISLKTPEFLGFSAQVCRRRPSPRGRHAGIPAAVSVWQFCGSVSLLTG
jgi:hypothetical protein